MSLFFDGSYSGFVSVDVPSVTIEDSLEDPSFLRDNAIQANGSQYSIRNSDVEHYRNALGIAERLILGVFEDRHVRFGAIVTEDDGVAFIGECQEFIFTSQIDSLVSSLAEQGVLDARTSPADFVNELVESEHSDAALALNRSHGNAHGDGASHNHSGEASPTWDDLEALDRILDVEIAPAEVYDGLERVTVVLEADSPVISEAPEWERVCVLTTDGWASPCVSREVIVDGPGGLFRFDFAVPDSAQLRFFVGRMEDSLRELTELEARVDQSPRFGEGVVWVTVVPDATTIGEAVRQLDVLTVAEAISRANELLPEGVRVDADGLVQLVADDE